MLFWSQFRMKTLKLHPSYFVSMCPNPDFENQLFLATLDTSGSDSSGLNFKHTLLYDEELKTVSTRFLKFKQFGFLEVGGIIYQISKIEKWEKDDHKSHYIILSAV